MAKIGVSFFIFIWFFSFSAFAKDSITPPKVDNEKIKTFDNTQQIVERIKRSSKKEGSHREKITYFSQMNLDISPELQQNCQQIFTEMANMIPLESQTYFSIASLYCRQTQNAEGISVAEYLMINHFVESDGSEESLTDLNQFLENFNHSKIYEQVINYYPVDYLIKHRTIEVTHSFVDLYELLQEEFLTPVRDYAHFIAESESFLKNIDLKNKNEFLNYIKNKTGANAEKLKIWEGLFDNPQADVISVYNNQVEIVVKSLPTNFIATNLFNHDDFIDTRWDEFIDAPSFTNYVMDKICVTIDTKNTAHNKYPNIASDIFDPGQYFYVFHGKEACFNYLQSYYMEHFFGVNGNAVWYSTTCRFLPYYRYQGKTMHYIGDRGDYKCPVD